VFGEEDVGWTAMCFFNNIVNIFFVLKLLILKPWPVCLLLMSFGSFRFFRVARF